jgi:carboxyl-terminal processing protease
MKRYSPVQSAATAVLLVLFPLCALCGSPDGDYFLEVNKGIDVFGRVYKEITANYVDQIRPQEFMEAGIMAMLNSLDPYTVYIEREESDEVELLTSGKYGGIGVTIGYREGMIQIITVMDGYSAQRQGVMPGDWIREVDSVTVEGIKPEQVRNLTRGAPGTAVELLIEREGEPEPLRFVLIRDEIRLRNVTYAAHIEPVLPQGRRGGPGGDQGSGGTRTVERHHPRSSWKPRWTA